MKTLKKLFSVSAIVALLGTLAPMYAFGATYTAELEEAYTYAHKNGITTMSSIDNANMFGTLTRVAMAKMIANYATTVLGLEPDTSAKCTFTDVTAALDAQYDNGVTNACQLGLMGQKITAFRPNDPVTRGEFGTTLSRALNRAAGTTIEEGNPYYENHLKYLNSKGIMKDISNPSMLEVRGYVMLMMMRADDSYTPATEGCTAEELLACVTADDYDACIAACSGNEEPEVLPGYATVSTKAAASQTVALNAVDKKIGTVTLKAGDNDTTVTNIEITKSGLGQRADILNVQLMRNGEYVTDGKAFGSDNKAKLRFRPNLVLKANGSETFDVVVSMDGANAEPNGQHEFSVTAVTVANGTFAGTPARLGSLTTTNYRIPAISIDSITAGATYDAGDEDANIVSIDLSAPVNATINSLTITSRDDELDKAFANAKAYIDDVEVGTVTINDETIVVEGLDKKITKSDTVTVDVKADVIFVGPTTPATTFRLYVDDNHINATEDNTNERMTSAKTADVNVSVKGVELTITKVIKDTQTVAPGTNVKLMSLKLESKTDLEVSKYYVQFPASFPFANFEDGELTLYVDGIDYTITGGMLDGANKYILSNKNDRFSVSSNNSVSITLEGKLIKNSPDFTVTSDSIKFFVEEVKNLENNKEIDSLTVNKGCHTTKVNAGTYTVTKPATMPTNKTVIAGEPSDVLFFNIKASTENLILKEVDVYSAAKFNTFATEVSLMQGNTVVKTFDDEDAELNANTITFDKLTKNLNKDATVPFTVRVTTKDGEVTTLGSSFKVDLTRVRTARSATPSVTTDKTSGLIAGNTYQITSNIPSIALTAKAGKDTTIEFTNNSAYNVVLNSIKFEVTQNKVDGDYSNISGSVTILDAIGGSVVAKTTGGTPAVKAVYNVDTDTLAGATTAKNNAKANRVNAIAGEISAVATISSTGATTVVFTTGTCTASDTGSFAGYVAVCGSSNDWTYTIPTAEIDSIEATAENDYYNTVKATVVDGTYVYTYDDDNHVITATQKVAEDLSTDPLTINGVDFDLVTAGVTGIDGTIAGATVPGTVTITFADDINTVDNSPLTRVIELLGTNNTITEADYTITIKELNFNYVDGTNMSQSIVETYNVSK